MRNKVEKLFDLLGVGSNSQKTFDGLIQALKKRDKDFELPEAYLNLFIERMIDVYVDTYTEEEIKFLVDFYSSDIGKKFVEKTPEISLKILEVNTEISNMVVDDWMKSKETGKEIFTGR